MKYIGKWEVSAALSFVDGEIKWVTREEANDIEDFDLSLFSPIMEFAPDGTVLTLYRIPEGMPQEEIDEAVSRGAVVAGDFLAMEKREWKEDGGKILYNTQIVGEFLGEEVSPWAEITEDENGEITMMEMIRLKRI